MGLGWFGLALPEPLFQDPYSQVLNGSDGSLLQARIAADGQWRFPEPDSLPRRYEKALLCFEDRSFYQHPGVNPLALFRALKQNLARNRVVSGASTLSMQVIRLSHRNPPRSLGQKLRELILALRLEIRYSKKSILRLYAGHAPFGGNVVGLQAASWRFFGRSPENLSWAESATLAVLPNSPGLMHPGRNRDRLRAKRDRLLLQLRERGELDEESYRLALLEPLPQEPLPLPQLAPHLLTSLQQGKIPSPAAENPVWNSSLHPDWQVRVARLLQQHQKQWSANSIRNGAVLVMEVESGLVRAYVGNSASEQPALDQSFVDIITAPRSPGSTLKPFLYEAMLAEGSLLPHTLIPDIPTQFGAYAPRNFDLGYDGAIPADKALSRSLNIPAVRMLQQYRSNRFLERLRKLGITTLNRPASHYGLSLILGGGENSLWELAGLYASMGRVVLHHRRQPGKVFTGDIRPPSVLENNPVSGQWERPSTFTAASCFYTLEAMQEVMRPGEEMLWEQFSSAQRIAWKTGTSFGFRDAWAIGLTPRYLVAVWVGNADGEGRPGLIGVEKAAPLLFDVFRFLPQAESGFPRPDSELETIAVCRQSGFRAHPDCPEQDPFPVPRAGLRSGACPYHQTIHLEASGRFRVQAACYPPDQMLHRSWFVLPPAMESYYKPKNPAYQPLPEWKAGCQPDAEEGSMELIYPRKGNAIFIPKELDGQPGRCILEATHRTAGARIHWHLDGFYLGSTEGPHKMALQPEPGWHRLSLSDDQGQRIEQSIRFD